MKQKKQVFLSMVLKPRYEKEFLIWQAAIQQDFDISVVCETKEMTHLLSDFLSAKLKAVGLQQRVQLVEPEGALNVENSTSSTIPEAGVTHIYVTSSAPPTGSGTVVFNLPRLEDLLPSATSMVRTLLELTSLERFVDAFDGRRMTQLKSILDRQGVDDFFDAVIQVAFQVGFRADESGADHYLERLLTETPKSKPKTPRPLENSTTSLEKLFEQLIELPEPHDVLKAALAHYVSVHRRVSQTEASKMLKVSRSTFQAHLSLAERLKIADYFTSWGSHA